MKSYDYCQRHGCRKFLPPLKRKYCSGHCARLAHHASQLKRCPTCAGPMAKNAKTCIGCYEPRYYAHDYTPEQRAVMSRAALANQARRRGWAITEEMIAEWRAKRAAGVSWESMARASAGVSPTTISALVRFGSMQAYKAYLDSRKEAKREAV